MTDREKLLATLLQQSEREAHRGVDADVSALDVIAMLEALGAEHRRVAGYVVRTRSGGSGIRTHGACTQRFSRPSRLAAPASLRSRG